MTTHAEVLASLQKHAPLIRAFHNDIVNGMKADGLVEDGNGGQIHAAADRQSRIRSINAACADPVVATKLRRLVAFAAHRGITLQTDQVIDVATLDKQFRESHRPVSVEDRMMIKNELAVAGCL